MMSQFPVIIDKRDPNIEFLGSEASGAVFSKDKRFRFLLWRIWDESKPLLHWCMLNPSSADQNESDPTLTKCCSFAKKWKMGGVILTNLFPAIATYPVELLKMDDRRGPMAYMEGGIDGPDYVNKKYLLFAAQNSDLTIVGWGNNVQRLNCLRVIEETVYVLNKVRPVKCIRKTKMGHPSHPLYIPLTAEPIDWSI